MYSYTDPPGCGCGFMTLERMYRLLGITMITRRRAKAYSGQQLVFPDIRFTCSGEVVRWIMGGRWTERGDYYPQLQIWRPSGNGVYHRLSGSNISTTVERDDDNVYEFVADPPSPFQSGDIVGVFQPQKGKLWVNYDTQGRSVNYYINIGNNEVMPSHNTIDTSDEDLQTSMALPLVSVEIGEPTCVSKYCWAKVYVVCGEYLMSSKGMMTIFQHVYMVIFASEPQNMVLCKYHNIQLSLYSTIFVC